LLRIAQHVVTTAYLVASVVSKIIVSRTAPGGGRDLEVRIDEALQQQVWWALDVTVIEG